MKDKFYDYKTIDLLLIVKKIKYDCTKDNPLVFTFIVTKWPFVATAAISTWNHICSKLLKMDTPGFLFQYIFYVCDFFVLLLMVIELHQFKDLSLEINLKLAEPSDIPLIKFSKWFIWDLVIFTYFLFAKTNLYV